MSIDSTPASTLSRKKTLKSVLSQSVNYPYTLKDRRQQTQMINRGMSVSEENSGDTLTDLSSMPYMPSKPENNKRNRRFSELKPTLNETTNSERRNSTSQINFGGLLPNPFRSNKHQHKNTTKDETNNSIETPNNSFPLPTNDTMTMRAEPFSSSKILNSNMNGSRTNLSSSSDLSSSISHDDSVFTLDTTQYEPQSAETLMLGLNMPFCVAEVYRKHFLEYFHTNYSGELEQEGPFIASLRCFYSNSDNSTCQARAIIRVPSRNYDVSVMVDATNEDDILQLLFKKANLSTIQTCKPTGNLRANEKIYLFDKSNDERHNCKIGFIYQRTDQTDESEIFNNDDSSPAMLEFLRILADRVPLKGFDKYRGDLDVKNDLHGEYSYYTQYNDHEIMFNIAPLIPSPNITGQCVKRKGLVGNSFVCIVFQEPDAEFLPDFVSGKVTQIYITVQPLKLSEQVYYKIGIWHRNDVTSLIDPPGGIYECDKSFRDYFLTLLLNAIHVAIESPSLRHCIADQRQRLKHEELKKLAQVLSLEQMSDSPLDTEQWYSFNNQRTGSVISLNTQSTNENTTPDPGRVSPAPTKKRTLSKIFSALTGRSSLSTTVNSDGSTIIPLSSEVNNAPNRFSSTNRDPMKRAASVKHNPAPSPPNLPRAPVSYKYSLASTTQSHSSSHSKTSGLTSENASSQSNLLNISPHDEIIRSRSNSSPGDHANAITKCPLSTVSTISKEISDTTSSIGDCSDGELDDDERPEHRPTLTENSLYLPATNL